MLNIQARQEDETSILSIKGKVNFEVTPQLKEVINDAIAEKQSKLLVINMEGVSFIDSSGLGLLLAARKKLDGIGSMLHICNVSAQVKKAFDQTNLTNYFSIFASEQEALRGG